MVVPQLSREGIQEHHPANDTVPNMIRLKNAVSDTTRSMTFSLLGVLEQMSEGLP